MSYAGSSSRQVQLRPRINVDSLLKVKAVPLSTENHSFKPILPKLPVSTVGTTNVKKISNDQLSLTTGICYLCQEDLMWGYRLFQSAGSNSSKTVLKIAQLMGDGCLVIVKPEDVVCEKCNNLLMYLMLLEEEVNKIKIILQNFIAEKWPFPIEVKSEMGPINEDLFGQLMPKIQSTLPVEQSWVKKFNQSRTGSQAAPSAVPTQLPAPREPLKCPMCQLHFDTPKLLKSHKIQDHLSSWICHFCNEKIEDQTEYTEHMNMHIMVSNKCSDCNEVFASKKLLIEHITNYHSVQTKPADEEDVSAFAFIPFPKEERFSENNEENLMNLELLDKDKTTETYEQNESPQNLIHLIAADNVSTEDNNELVCAQCGRMFTSLTDMAEHIQTDHAVEEYSECFMFDAKQEVQETHADLQVDTDESINSAAINLPSGEEQEVLESIEQATSEDLGLVDKQELMAVEDLEEDNADDVVIAKNELNEQYYCDRCGSVGNSEEWLGMHVMECNETLGEDTNIEEEPKGAELAARCGEGAFTSQIAKTSRVYYCFGCGTTFLNKAELSAHERDNPEHGIIACPNCDESLPNERALNAHRETEHTDWLCRHCNKLFSNLKQLKAHESRHILSLSMKLQCPFKQCGRIFKTQTGLRHHLVSHTGNFKYSCEFCTKGFMTKAQYEDHKAGHTKEDRYECDKCGAKFHAQATYWIHRKWHDNPRPYKCDICQRLYKHSSMLAVHKRKHTGEKPYSCPYCPQKFYVTSSLNRHVTLHTREFPFTCEACEVGFVARHKMAQHMSKIHKDDSMLQEQIRNKSRKLVMAVNTPDENEET